jgi:hypothetical protein
MTQLNAVDEFQISFGEGALNCLNRVYQEGNLTHFVLQAHLLVERALTARLREQSSRPEVREQARHGRGHFSSKVQQYVRFCNPSKSTEEQLLALNKLRNMIAHELESEAYCTEMCLPQKAEPHQMPTPLDRVLLLTLMILSDLGVMSDVENTDRTKSRENRLKSAQGLEHVEQLSWK